MDSINGDLTGGTLLNHLLLCVVRQKFTSLVLQPLGSEVCILARGDGNGVEIGRLETTHYRALTGRIRKLAGIAAVQGISASGILKFMWQGKRIPFQALLIGGDGGEYVTLKLWISAPPLCGLADLCLSPSKNSDLRALAGERAGLILFSGGEPEERCRMMELFLDACDDSGKTVLLIGERLGGGRKRFPRLPVNRNGRDDTASIVAAVLDHDPDTLVVEDVTAHGSFLEASKAVMRGKLVVAGMSHRDSEAVLMQLLNLREKNFLIPTQLKGVISCKAVPLLCPACKERYAPPPEELAPLRLSDPPAGYFRPHGCPACGQSGYSGRRYLLEVIRFDRGLLEVFESSHKSSEIIRFMKDNGYRGIVEEGTELLKRGEISPCEYVVSILL
jgi:type II secretory ATPase GspE/PulE/Tfp pilus assembly ATPase PilB-like protein